MTLKDILAKIKGAQAGGSGLKVLLGGFRTQIDSAIEEAAKQHGVNVSPEAMQVARNIVDSAKDKVASIVAEHEAHADQTAAAIASPPASA